MEKLIPGFQLLSIVFPQCGFVIGWPARRWFAQQHSIEVFDLLLPSAHFTSDCRQISNFLHFLATALEVDVVVSLTTAVSGHLNGHSAHLATVLVSLLRQIRVAASRLSAAAGLVHLLSRHSELLAKNLGHPYHSGWVRCFC